MQHLKTGACHGIRGNTYVCAHYVHVCVCVASTLVNFNFFFVFSIVATQSLAPVVARWHLQFSCSFALSLFIISHTHPSGFSLNCPSFELPHSNARGMLHACVCTCNSNSTDSVEPAFKCSFVSVYCSFVCACVCARCPVAVWEQFVFDRFCY